jgi:hypothetical protein
LSEIAAAKQSFPALCEHTLPENGSGSGNDSNDIEQDSDDEPAEEVVRVSDMSLLKRAERLFVQDVRETKTFSLDEDFWFRKKPHYVINLLNHNHEFEEVPQRGWNTPLNFIPYNEKVVTFLKSQEGNNVRVEIWKDGIVKGKVTSTSELVQDMIKVDCSLIG